MLRIKYTAGNKIEAPSVIKRTLLSTGSLEDINVHNAKKVCKPKKVTMKPKNLKSFKDSCGAINAINTEKINW